MPRPRVASDDQILRATARLAGALGPLRMTLADVAREVGVTPSAIVQRFGSKRELLLASSEHAMRDLDDGFRRARERAGGGALDALVEGVAAVASGWRTPREVGVSLSFLQLDLTDAAFRRSAQGFFASFDRNVAALLEEAVARRELRAEADVARLARAVGVTFHGSVLAWAIRDDGGSVTDALREDLRALLAPHLTGSRSGSPAGAAPARRRGRARAP